VTLHLEGGNVVITGGAGLLGRALANAFAARGARIVVVDVLGEPARVVADEVRELHQVPSIAIEADVADRGSMDEVARRDSSTMPGARSSSHSSNSRRPTGLPCSTFNSVAS
jgi:NAD(P)-dependent dehydrogenase (short-subunit alcohol dehydrogenase family)